MDNVAKVDWWSEELDIYYRKNGYPTSVWKDNEGMPYGIYYYFDKENDLFDVECFWFKTIEERDKAFDEEIKEVVDSPDLKEKNKDDNTNT